MLTANITLRGGGIWNLAFKHHNLSRSYILCGPTLLYISILPWIRNSTHFVWTGVDSDCCFGDEDWLTVFSSVLSLRGKNFRAFNLIQPRPPSTHALSILQSTSLPTTISESLSRARNSWPRWGVTSQDVLTSGMLKDISSPTWRRGILSIWIIGNYIENSYDIQH